MRIAVVSPLVESVPPTLYGGTERVVSNLAEELVRRGHEVTLFASGDSITSAKLVPCVPRALRLDPDAPDFVTATLFEFREVYKRAAEFDIIHNHADWFGFAFSESVATPTVTTAHGRLDISDIAYRYRCAIGHPLVSVSRDQMTYLPDVNWVGTVHNGIDVSRFHLRPFSGDYLVFLGRISPEKGPDKAVEIAERAGMRLIVAAKVDPAEQDYYENVIAPLFRRSPYVDFIGEVDEAGKDQLLGGAYAYLFPIDWPEPFGLTMIEAMATGTPVIAMARGSVPEVVVDGESGFVCDSIDEMVEATERVSSINRLTCRRRVEQLFSASRMADGYEEVYSRLAIEGCSTPRSVLASNLIGAWSDARVS